jgi:hypothetical protein
MILIFIRYYYLFYLIKYLGGDTLRHYHTIWLGGGPIELNIPSYINYCSGFIRNVVAIFSKLC